MRTGQAPPEIGTSSTRRRVAPAFLRLDLPVLALHDPLEQEADTGAEAAIRVVHSIAGSLPTSDAGTGASAGAGAGAGAPAGSGAGAGSGSTTGGDIGVTTGAGAGGPPARAPRAAGATGGGATGGSGPGAPSRPGGGGRGGGDPIPGGRALPQSVRAELERRLGHDLGRVRIHTGPDAAAAAAGRRADAFTVSGHIVFAADRFQPATAAGQALLAHELTHTIQHAARVGDGPARHVARVPGRTDAATGDAGEAVFEGPRAIGVPWRQSVVRSLVVRFRGFSDRSEADLVTSATRLANGWTFVFRITRNGQLIGSSGLDRARFEQLMNQYGEPTWTLGQAAAEEWFSEIGLDWDRYDVIVAHPLLEALAEGGGRSVDEVLGRRPGPAPVTDNRPRLRVEFPPGTSADRMARFQRFLTEVFEGRRATPAAEDDSVYVSTSELEAIDAFYREPEAERAALLERLRPSGRGGQEQGPVQFDDLINSAMARRRYEAMATRMGREVPESSDRERPIVARPVHGRIVSNQEGHGREITPGMKVVFQFVTTDQVDAFRVPHVSIRWQAVRLVDRRGRQVNQQVRTEVTNYIEVRDDGFLNDRTFDVTFGSEGTYAVRALVNHNFYMPDAFETGKLRVVGTDVVGVRLAAEGDPGFANAGSRPADRTHSFSGIVGDYALGRRYYGRLTDERFAARTGSFADSLRDIEADIAEVTQLQTHYRADPAGNADLLDWIEQRLKKLNDTKQQLEAHARGTNTHPIAVRGYYVSQTSGVPHRQLDLVAWFSFHRDEDGDPVYSGHLLDHSGVTGPHNLHFTETAGSYEAMTEALFVELSSDYPDGQMIVRFQLYEEDQASQRLVSYERETDTLTSDIAEVAFSAPVSLAVNVVAAILTVFPPTTGLGIAISLTYNGLSTAYTISEAIESDTLRAAHAIDVGLLALDVIPAVGHGIHALATAGRVVKVVGEGSVAYHTLRISSRVAEYAGQLYVFTDDALEQIDALRTTHIDELAQIHLRVERLRAQHAPEELVAVELRREEQVIAAARRAAVETFATLAAQQAISMAGPHFAGELARSRVDARRRTTPTVPEPPPPADRSGAPSGNSADRRRRRRAEQRAEEQQRQRRPGGEPAEPRPDTAGPGQDGTPARPDTTERRPDTAGGRRRPGPDREPDGAGSDRTEPDVDPNGPAPGGRAQGRINGSIPDTVVVDARPVQVRPSGEAGHGVRIHFETGQYGTITRIWVEVGADADVSHLRTHVPTIRLLQRFQGLAGAMRIAITRIHNAIERFKGINRELSLPARSTVFEAEAEMLKLPGVVADLAAKLGATDLTALERADIMAELDQHQLDFERYREVFDRFEFEMGAGFVAARHEPSSNAAALAAGYPSLEGAPGHYYLARGDGTYVLQRFSWSDDPPKTIVSQRLPDGSMRHRIRPAAEAEPGAAPTTVLEATSERPVELGPPEGTTGTRTRATRDGNALEVTSTDPPGTNHTVHRDDLFTAVDRRHPDEQAAAWEASHQSEAALDSAPPPVLLVPGHFDQVLAATGVPNIVGEVLAALPRGVEVRVTTVTRADASGHRLAIINHTVEVLAPDGTVRGTAIRVQVTVGEGAAAPVAAAVHPDLSLVLQVASEHARGPNPAVAVAGAVVGGGSTPARVVVSDPGSNLVGRSGGVTPASRARDVAQRRRGGRTSRGTIDTLVQPGPTANQAHVPPEAVDAYMRDLGHIYDATGAALQPEVEAAIRDYLSTPFPLEGRQPDGTGLSNAGKFPGTHAEVWAVNQALARARVVDQTVGPGDLTVATTRPDSASHMVACLHCRGILERLGVRVETGVAEPHASGGGSGPESGE